MTSRWRPPGFCRADLGEFQETAAEPPRKTAREGYRPDRPHPMNVPDLDRQLLAISQNQRKGDE